MVSFACSIMKNFVVTSSRSRFSVNFICSFTLGSASNASNCYHSIVLIEIIVILQTTSCLIISLTCCNVLNIIINSHTTFKWLLKKVFSINHNIIIFYFYFWKIISCFYFSPPHFQTIKQKVH